MARGRKPNYDRRIAELIEQLKAALVAKEQAQLEEYVSAKVAGITSLLRDGRITTAEATRYAGAAPSPMPKSKAPAVKAKKTGRPSAGRLRQIAAMKAYWKKRKAAQAKKSSKAEKAEAVKD